VTAPASSTERLLVAALVLAAIFMVVSLYVRITTDSDPLWTEFATPLFFALLGVRSIARPAPPERRKAARGLGILLIVCAAVILSLNLLDYFQGAQ